MFSTNRRGESRASALPMGSRLMRAKPPKFADQVSWGCAVAVMADISKLADVMAKALAEEGMQMTHIIGPKI
jgi:hypothetical protein